jgi:putrescine transport system substrate-binding protein
LRPVGRVFAPTPGTWVEASDNMRLLTSFLLAALSFSSAVFAEKLYIYNWSDYFAPDTISRFEKETGIEVVYDVYDSNQILEAKLYAGNTGYDLVFPTNYPYFYRQVQVGIYQPINPQAVPALAGVDPALSKPLVINEKLMGVPYLWNTVGIAYDQDKINKIFGGKPPADSWAFVLDPENMKKLAGCKVAFLDSPIYLYPIILNYLGLKQDSQDYADFQRATAVMTAIRPYIVYFHDSQYLNDLANGNICVAVGWSGDLVMARNRAKESGNKINIRYMNPKEGSLFLYDVMAIPATAKNVDAAQKFINYILQPKEMADLTNNISYPNPVSSSRQYMKKDILGDPAIFPSEATMAHFFAPTELPLPLEKRINRDWAKMRVSNQ